MILPKNLIDALEPEFCGSNPLNDPMSTDFEPQIFKLTSYSNRNELIEFLNSHKDQFNILSLNIQSINAKFSMFSLLIYELGSQGLSFDAICLQETWLEEDSPIELFKLDGYHLINAPRQLSKHGGLNIYLMDSYKYKIRPVLAATTWENLVVEVILDNSKNIIIGDVYRNPEISGKTKTESLAIFQEEFVCALDSLSKLNAMICIAGDFNCNLLESDSDVNISSFCDSIIASSFLPAITAPTRYDNFHGTATLIDNIFIKLPEHNFSSTILTSPISDHYACVTSFPLSNLKLTKNKRNVPPKRITIQDFSEENISIFKELLDNMNITDFNHALCTDPNLSYETLEQKISKAREIAFPKKTVKFNKRKHTHKAWMSKGILISINFRDQLYRDYINAPLNSQARLDFKINLDSYNNILKKSIRNAQARYYQRLFMNFSSDMKRTWQSINKVLGRSQTKSDYPESFKIDNRLVSDKQEIANCFNDFFTNIGKNLADSIQPPSGIDYKSFLKHKTKLSFSFKTITENDVLEIIDSLQAKSSHGYDFLSTKLLKRIKELIVPPLTIIINQSLTSGIFPDNLKIAKITPIYKKGDNTTIDNYRPISLLPAISKVFEKAIHIQVMKYLTDNNLFYSSQFGFRPGHSTELAAIEFVDRVLTYMDNDETPFSIFMDLSKAFDTLNHDILIDKLSYYGLDVNAIKLFKSYLSNRMQFVSFMDSNSTKKVISTGVPQGSILGPLLFLIYINDIKEASRILDIISYADDTTLIGTFEKFKKKRVSVEFEISRISNWLLANKLSLNIIKTKFMIFHKGNKSLPNTENFKINGKAIERVKSFIFLGLTIDDKLTWKNHINKVCNKISKVNGILNKFKNFLPKDILLSIYNSLILPHLNYCLLTWGFGIVNRIQKIQKRAVRYISHSEYRAHTAPLFNSLRLLTFDDIFMRLILKFLFQVQNSMLPEYFKTFITKRNSDIHSFNTRRKNELHRTHENHKMYTRNCIKYCLQKIQLNISSSQFHNKQLDPDEFILNFEIDRLSKICQSKSTHLLCCIIDKIKTHSLDGYLLYIKNRFLQSYI